MKNGVASLKRFQILSNTIWETGTVNYGLLARVSSITDALRLWDSYTIHRPNIPIKLNGREESDLNTFTHKSPLFS